MNASGSSVAKTPLILDSVARGWRSRSVSECSDCIRPRPARAARGQRQFVDAAKPWCAVHRPRGRDRPLSLTHAYLLIGAQLDKSWRVVRIRARAELFQHRGGPDGNPPLDHGDHGRALLQAHIEFSAEVDDFSGSGDHPKCTIGLMGDLEVCLAGGEYDEPFLLAVPDGDRAVGIQMQYANYPPSDESAARRVESLSAVP